MYVLHTHSRFACVSGFCSQRNLRGNFGFAAWGVIVSACIQRISLACSRMVRLCSLYSQPAIWSQWYSSCWLPSKSLSLILSGHGAKFSFSSLDSTNPVIVFLSNFDFNGSFAWTFFGANHSHKLRVWGVSSDNNYCNITLHHSWRKRSRKTSWTRVTVCGLPINGGLTSWVLVSMLSIGWYQDSPGERLK